MTTPLADTGSLRVPGRLCAAPTSIGTFPHGGTDLGNVVAIDFYPQTRVLDIEDESIGGERTETVRACESALLQVVLGSMTTAMLSKVLAHTSGGGGGYGTAGDDSVLGSADEFVLLFSPRSSAHPALIMYRACPSWADSAQLGFSIGSDVGAAVAFRGIRHASKGVYQVDVLGSISL